jgi:hypothetical protein
VPTTEDRVKARLDAEKAAAKKALDAANKGVKDAGSAEFDLREKLVATLDLMGQAALLDQPKPPTAKQRDQADDFTRRHGKAVKAFVVACERRAEALKALRALESDKEFDRRVKAAKKIEAKGGEAIGEVAMSGAKAAEVVLLSQGRPMHYTEITRVALETGVVKLTGKTPEATMSAYLAKAAKAGDTFVRVEPGIFDLKARAKAA